MPAYIDDTKCCLKAGKCTCGGCNDGCRCCVEACPVEALKKGDSITVDSDKCINCGVCVEVCPNKAISINDA